jgi:hypothetical protein
MFKTIFVITLLGIGCSEGETTSKTFEPERVKPYTFELPKDVRPEEVAGLEVKLKADATASEGFYVDFYALKSMQVSDDGQVRQKKFSLGGRTFFKPPRVGETSTFYLNAPPKEAWQGDELKVGFQIKPAHPDRKMPDVSLQIVEVRDAPETKR